MSCDLTDAARHHIFYVRDTVTAVRRALWGRQCVAFPPFRPNAEWAGVPTRPYFLNMRGQVNMVAAQVNLAEASP